MKFFRCFAGAALFCLLSSSLAWAQATAQIHGVVQDGSGAAIPAASVKALQIETGLVRTVTSGADGGFVLASLPLGPYTVEVSKEGFSVAVQSGIVLQVGSDPSLPVSMKVGGVSERVTVEANATQVETRSSGVGTVIETQRILDLPLNGRQPTDLITLSGLAVQTGSSPAYTMSTGVNIAVAGGTSYSIQYNLDGASHLDTYGGTNMPLPFPDALQEFRLVTSTQEASGGGHSGASVNAVTKSGTNQLHGDLFEFFRNGNLNGRDFFAAADDKLKRNQFGGTIGGAIKKDKAFFFAGYQGTVTRQTPSDTTAFVPTAAMLTGDFTAYIANSCGPVDPGALTNGKLKQPLSPAALNISKFLPKSTSVCGRVSTGNPLSENRLQVPVRLDYQLGDKQSLFARYLVTRIDTKVPFDINPGDLLTTSGNGTDDQAQSLTLGHTFVINPTMVNSFRVFGNRVGSNKPGPKFPFDARGVGLNINSYLPNFVGIIVAGGFNLGVPANFNVSTGATTNFGLNEDVSLVRGSHQLSVGATLMRALLVGNSNAWDAGVFTIVGLPAAAGGTGNAIGDFLVGRILNIHQANPNPNYTTQNFLGLYAADVWKANSRLTLNYGVRWNPFFPMQFTQSDVSNFSLSSFYAGTKSKVIPSAPAGFTYPGDAGFNGRAGLNNRWGNFEPRFGFSWDPRGDGKTSIRGGAGIAYDFIRQDLHQNTSSVAPFRLTVVTGTNLDNPYGTAPGSNPFPYTFNPKNPVFPTSPSYQGFFPIPPDLQTTRQYSWNLGIQRQVTKELFASATYVGTHLIHTWSAIDLNPGQFIPGNCVPGQYGLTKPGACSNADNVNQRRLLELTNPAAGNILGSMTQLDDGGTQRYNGMLLNATWRKGNVNLAGNYTWSHCIGLPITTLTNLQSTYPHQPFQNIGANNRSLDMGDCSAAGGNSGSLDIRHLANLTLVASTPKFSGTWARRLGTGWTLSTIYTVRSGIPLTPSTGVDRAQNGLFQGAGAYLIPQRPNQVLADTSATNRGSACINQSPCVNYFNPAAFSQPALNTYGNIGVGSLRGPGFWEWDQTISRQFKVAEGQRVEIRVEAFNLTNSVRFYIAGNANALNFNNGQFGRITTSASTTGTTAQTGQGGRIMQLALKYVF